MKKTILVCVLAVLMCSLTLPAFAFTEPYPTEVWEETAASAYDYKVWTEPAGTYDPYEETWDESYDSTEPTKDATGRPPRSDQPSGAKNPLDYKNQAAQSQDKSAVLAPPMPEKDYSSSSSSSYVPMPTVKKTDYTPIILWSVGGVLVAGAVVALVIILKKKSKK